MGGVYRVLKEEGILMFEWESTRTETDMLYSKFKNHDMV